MLDRLLALLSIACFAGFVGILVVYVTEPDLTIICVAVVAMAMADFFLLNRSKTDKSGKPGD